MKACRHDIGDWLSPSIVHRPERVFGNGCCVCFVCLVFVCSSRFASRAQSPTALGGRGPCVASQFCIFLSPPPRTRSWYHDTCFF